MDGGVEAAIEVATNAKGSAADVLTVPTDVGKPEEVQRLTDRVYETFGDVAVLMNNAGTSPGGGPREHYECWQRRAVNRPDGASPTRSPSGRVPIFPAIVAA